MERIVDLQQQDMSDDFVTALVSTMSILVPLDGGQECEDMWYALCAA